MCRLDVAHVPETSFHPFDQSWVDLMSKDGLTALGERLGQYTLTDTNLDNRVVLARLRDLCHSVQRCLVPQKVLRIDSTVDVLFTSTHGTLVCRIENPPRNDSRRCAIPVRIP